MGESITEGTISKWMKAVHDQVRADEVVVVIETDKVSVDIKSSVSGVLVEKTADENVSVGQPIFKVDTTRTQSISISTPSKDSSPPPKKETSSASSVHVGSESKARIPLIKFIGKRSKLPKGKASSKPTQSDQAAAQPPESASKPKKKPTGVDFFTLKGGALYGRPKISEAESEAIESGGASMLSFKK